MTTVLEVDGLSKKFGALTVIEELSFSLGAGEALGVVGPNGAGKTTTLNMIAGDFPPTTGTVRFNGVDVTTAASHQRCRAGLGRTSQIPRPFDGLSVFENVMTGATFGAKLRGPDAVNASIRALDQSSMLDKANLQASSLSLLDRKRLELARALATGPTVLLLDEIAGGLTDAEVQELIITIRTIRESGISIVWIEHIVHALLSVVDRMMAMDYGRKLLEGDPHAVMASADVQRIYLGHDDNTAATAPVSEAKS
jgi:branched-chain amino acid transport system ATP-binding protein